MTIEFKKALGTTLIVFGCLKMTAHSAEGEDENTSAAKQKQRMIHQAVDSLEGHLDQFQIEIQYHGPDKKKHYSIWLSVPKPPEKLPSHYLSVQISKAAAKKIIKQLAETDFLWRGTINREKRLRTPKSPFYTLYVEGEKGDAYFEHVAIGPKLVTQLKALRGVLDGEAADAIKKLIQPLETNPEEKDER